MDKVADAGNTLLGSRVIVPIQRAPQTTNPAQAAASGQHYMLRPEPFLAPLSRLDSHGKDLDWTVIDVEVTNNSSRSTSFGVGNQMVIGTDGNTYEVSWTDATSINQNSALRASIPAHHTMKFRVPVALPEGVTPAVLSVKVGRDPVQEIGLR